MVNLVTGMRNHYNIIAPGQPCGRNTICLRLTLIGEGEWETPRQRGPMISRLTTMRLEAPTKPGLMVKIEYGNIFGQFTVFLPLLQLLWFELTWAGSYISFWLHG